MLKEKMEDKDFNYTVVKQGRWSATNFQTLSGKEHLFQSDLSEFANKLFFNDKLNFFELYNSVKLANEQAP